MTLSGSESRRGIAPDPRSLALRFVGFTHSACRYYSQLFSTTQIGLARTLVENRCDSLGLSASKDFLVCNLYSIRAFENFIVHSTKIFLHFITSGIIINSQHHAAV